MSFKHKNLLRIGGLALVSALFVQTAHAANPLGDILGGIGNDYSQVAGFLIMLATTLSFIFFNLLNVFLNPTVIFDMDTNNSNLINALNTIWQLSRDIMNVIFAFVLAGVAIYMVVTAKKEFIKEYMGKFVLAVILVNFSWFFPRVILDVAHVLAATIYDIPMMIHGTNPKFCGANGIPTEYQGITDMEFFLPRCVAGAPPPAPLCMTLHPGPMPDGSSLPPTAPAGWQCIGDGIICYRRANIDFQTVAGHSAILNGLIMNHAALQQMANVPDPYAGTNPFMEQIVFLIKLGIIVIIAFSLVFPLAAMTIAMLIRIPVLWITIAFMPFIFLSFIGGEKLQQFIGDKGPKAIWETFLKFAFLPALVAIPLSVGFILIQAGAIAQCNGGLGGGAMATGILQATRLNLPMASNLYQLIWLLMTQIVLWMGVFSVLKGTPIVGSISEKIADTGKTFGRLAWKIPAAATPIPGASISAYNMFRALSPRGLEQAINSSGDLTKALEQIKDRSTGKISSAEKKTVDNAATQLNRDGMASLNTSINNLCAAFKLTGPARDKAIKDGIGGINTAAGTNLNQATMADFLRQLQTSTVLNAGNQKALQDNNINVNVVIDTINRPPPTATPPATSHP